MIITQDVPIMLQLNLTSASKPQHLLYRGRKRYEQRESTCCWDACFRDATEGMREDIELQSLEVNASNTYTLNT
jgi:hypothetical protein